MSQFNLDTPIDPTSKSGTTLAADLSSWRDAMHTWQSGASRPSYAVEGLQWLGNAATPLIDLNYQTGNGASEDVPYVQFNKTAATATFRGVGLHLLNDHPGDETQEWQFKFSTNDLVLRDETNAVDQVVVEANGVANQLRLDATGAVSISGAAPSGDADLFLMGDGVLATKEIASGPTADSTYGKWWTDTTLHVPMFQDGTAGVDRQIAQLELAQEWLKQQNPDAGTLTDGANISWDLDGDNQQSVSVTLEGDRTLDDPTNMKDGASYVAIVKQDAVGTRTLAYGTAYKWPGGSAPVLSTAINSVDILFFVSDGTSMYGNAVKAFA